MAGWNFPKIKYDTDKIVIFDNLILIQDSIDEKEDIEEIVLDEENPLKDEDFTKVCILKSQNPNVWKFSAKKIFLEINLTKFRT